MFEITINPSILDRLNDIQAALENCEPVISEAAKLVLLEHLSDKENGIHKSASRLGATPTGTYGEMAESVVSEYSPGRVALAIQHSAAAQRYYGGTISPVNATYLTIPMQAKAYGKTLDDFDDGFLDPFAWLYGRNGLYGVAEISDPDNILFALKKEVTQAPDPTVLPSDETWVERILQTLTDTVDL